MTIYRDLKKLHQEIKIQMVRVGAMTKSENIVEFYLSQRINNNLDKKQKLAEKSLELIIAVLIDVFLKQKGTGLLMIRRKTIEEQ